MFRLFTRLTSQTQFLNSVHLCSTRVLQLLTNHYEQNWKYYCLPSGWGSYGTASEDELLLTKKIFWGVFDSLSQRVRRRCSLTRLLLVANDVRRCNTRNALQQRKTLLLQDY